MDARIFSNLIEVREITAEWLEHYNNERPHEILGNLSPMQYLLKRRKLDIGILCWRVFLFQQSFTTPTTE
ncbi:transposase [Chryseobacterium sp. PS-8]|uniref:Transposase n=1 Tax=Chryseobacterium indicum TaxID=2766954 RepID=A0ABS9C647_9FLAO|nr:transposase [Chryseobacterium sp. PS-8]